MTDQPASRRPLASRNTRLARQAAGFLVTRGVAPNLISAASVGFAGVGLLFFWWSAGSTGFWGGVGLILAALACQLRLVCNLLDGMVAVEGGQGTASGPFWNEVPDRIADILLLAGLGIAAGHPGWGMCAAALAVFTAYLRELGRAEGLPADFSGPMAKPHRMAALTAVAVLAAFAPLFGSRIVVLEWGLWLILIGITATILRRSWRMIAGLRARDAG